MADTTQEGPGSDWNFELYRYTPSLAAAIVSVIVFGMLTAAHTWRLSRAKTFYFTAFTVGGLCECLSS